MDWHPVYDVSPSQSFDTPNNKHHIHAKDKSKLRRARAPTRSLFALTPPACLTQWMLGKCEIFKKDCDHACYRQRRYGPNSRQTLTFAVCGASLVIGPGPRNGGLGQTKKQPIPR